MSKSSNLKKLLFLAGGLAPMATQSLCAENEFYAASDLMNQGDIPVSKLLTKYQNKKAAPDSQVKNKAENVENVASEVNFTSPAQTLVKADRISVEELLSGKLPEKNTGDFDADSAKALASEISSPFNLQPGVVDDTQYVVSEPSLVDQQAAVFAANDVLHGKTKTLKVANNRGLVMFEPSSIYFVGVGDIVDIDLKGFVDQADVRLYSRSSAIFNVNSKDKKLVAVGEGTSELFIAVGDQIHIVPVTVSPKLANPAVAQNTSGLSLPSDVLALSDSGFTGLDKNNISAPSSALASLGTSSSDLKLAESKDYTLKNVANQQGKVSYSIENKSITYSDQIVQIIDERSVPSKNQIFPVGNVLVSVVGTEFKGTTDATGQIKIPNMPNNSRFLVLIVDPNDNYMPTISEVSTFGKNEVKINHLSTMRSFTFNGYTAVAGVVQNETHGSLCATLTDREGYVLEGASVTMDQTANGPYYFNKFGYLDPTLKNTGANGKVCFFNVVPGPYALTFNKDKFSQVVPLTSVAGFHNEEHFTLSRSAKINTHLAAMATAYSQLDRDVAKANEYKTIDEVELVPFGAEALKPVNEGQLSSDDDPLMAHHNRLFAYSTASEFEPTVYTYNNNEDENVTALIPRGFIEDMAIYSNNVHDPLLGSVVFEFGSDQSLDEENIVLTLTDHTGKEVNEGWYYGDKPNTKSVFFNLQPGVYQVQARTEKGHWLSSDTVIVYNGTVSYVRLGAKIVAQ